MTPAQPAHDPEAQRLADAAARTRNWKRWGPYLSERQWGTVREDYSADGNVWGSFTHDMARSRAYRWGEDGLLGICDRQCRLCFAVALWNGRDPILKERLFGLSGHEGNHGEDVKEAYFYLESAPTHSYFKALYKYPQQEFPYARLVDENRRRTKHDPEFELADTGIFGEQRYFDVFVEYAKADTDDILIRITCANRGPERATLHVLPSLWFRNTWSWGCTEEGCELRPRIQRASATLLHADDPTLGRFRLAIDAQAAGAPELLFTENETNLERAFGVANSAPHVKDAFHEYVIGGRADAVDARAQGTKAAAHFELSIEAGGTQELRLRLFHEDQAPRALFGADFEQVFAARKRELELYQAANTPAELDAAERAIVLQANAGLLWSKQFYHYVVASWLDGDADQPPPPEQRKHGRNRDWRHLYSRDVLSMPDKWEYPWYAAWDLAFHMIPMAHVDPYFAKEQLLLLLREWYMHANGQIPAYEFEFSDVNPPVHAWACWRVYKMTGPRGQRDMLFLERCFQKLLLNFTWWVNRKDPEGRHIFAGGFLGLDNIGVFDRSRPLPTGGHLSQADGTAWMASYCLTMLGMALELSEHNPAYEDIASKFFEHFVAICDAMNTLGGSGLWDEQDGFYYDQLMMDGKQLPLRVRSMVGIIPLFAVGVMEQKVIDLYPGFKKRMQWFLDHRSDLAEGISYMEQGTQPGLRLLALPSRERLVRVLRYVLDENEFLSPYGVRSLSRIHKDQPFKLMVDGKSYGVAYDPAESTSGVFGGNSNWRGPVWFPLNFLLIEALERYHHFYGDSVRVECPTGSGQWMNLLEVSDELNARLTRLFLPDADGRRPCHGGDERFARDPHWRELVLFHEYFHGDDGRGIGADHQTGWTALVTRSIEKLARARAARQNTQAAPTARRTAPHAAGARGSATSKPKDRKAK